MRMRKWVSIVSFLCYNVFVQAQNKDTLSHQLSPVIIQALRTPVPENSIPYSIGFLKPTHNIQGLSLAESVGTIPGLDVQARYNLSVGDRIINRGFGARTQFGVRGIQIILDDVPLTMADGQTNLEMLDLLDISSIELLRGPGSSLYGNSSGGVLKIYSVPIPEAPYSLSLSSINGPDGLFRWSGSAGVSFPKSRVLGKYTNFRYHGFREYSSADFNRAQVKLHSNLSSSDVLTFQAGYVDFNAQSPGALTSSEVSLNPRLANPFSVSNKAGEEGMEVQLSASWKHRYNSESSLQTIVYDSYRYVKNRIAGKIIDLPQTDGGINILYRNNLSLFQRKMVWITGLDAAFRFNNRKNYVNLSGDEGKLFMNQNENVFNTGLFTQLFIPVTPNLNAALSLRYDRTSFGVKDLFKDSVDNSGTRIMAAFSPSAGLIYRFDQSINLFANVSTSFETPTSTELANRPGRNGGFNPDLQPSRALGYETGLRGIILKQFRYDISAYVIHITDELIPFEVLPDVPGGQVYYRNAGSAVHRGFETSISWNVLPAIWIQTALTLIDAKFKEYTQDGVSYAGKKIPGISPRRISAVVNYHFPFPVTVSVQMLNAKSLPANDANTIYAPSYTLFNLNASYGEIAFGENRNITLVLGGGISNLFDKKYISAVTVNANANRYFEPGQERVFFLNARLDFKK